MERIPIEDLEKMTQTKYLSTQDVRIIDEALGDEEEHELRFDIFDGFAYCPDFNGKEVYMNFPTLAFIRKSADSQQRLREFLGLTDTEEIRVEHIMSAYNLIYVA
jgi:hypothetical protein